MASANDFTALRSDRYSDSFMQITIADAITDSNRQFRNFYPSEKICRMKKDDSTGVAKLRLLVKDAGGAAAFARKYSKDESEAGINPVYVNQLLNHHRNFGEKARKKMAEAAGLAPGYFEEQILQANQPVQVYQFSTETVTQIVAICEQLPPEWQKQALGAVRVIEAQYRDTQNSTQRLGS